MESVSIANGWRAAKPGSRNVQAPRVRSNWPYPGREVAAESVDCSAFIESIEFFDVVTVDPTAVPFRRLVARAVVGARAPRAVLLRGLR